VFLPVGFLFIRLPGAGALPAGQVESGQKEAAALGRGLSRWGVTRLESHAAAKLVLLITLPKVTATVIVLPFPGFHVNRNFSSNRDEVLLVGQNPPHPVRGEEFPHHQHRLTATTAAVLPLSAHRSAGESCSALVHGLFIAYSQLYVKYLLDIKFNPSPINACGCHS